MWENRIATALRHNGTKSDINKLMTSESLVKRKNLLSENVKETVFVILVHSQQATVFYFSWNNKRMKPANELNWIFNKKNQLIESKIK